MTVRCWRAHPANLAGSANGCGPETAFVAGTSGQAGKVPVLETAEWRESVAGLDQVFLRAQGIHDGLRRFVNELHRQNLTKPEARLDPPRYRESRVGFTA